MKLTMRLLAALTVGALVAAPVQGETSSLQSEPVVDATPREASIALSMSMKPRLLEEPHSSNNTVEEEHHNDEIHNDEDHQDDHNEEISSEANVRDDQPWGEAIGAALLVNLATLVGLVVFIPTLLAGTLCAARSSKASSEQIHSRHQKIIRNYLPSFGAGALLATAVFLIIPEAIELLSVKDEHEEHRRYLQEEEHSGENSMAWKFGTSFLGGYVLPIVLGSIFPHVHEEDPKYTSSDEEETREAIGDVEETRERTKTISRCEDEECSDRPHDLHATIAEEDISYLDDGSVYYEESVPSPVADKAVLIEDNRSEDPTTLSCVDEGCTDSDHHHEDMVQISTKGQTSMPPTMIQKPINWNLAMIILLGDACHNFADGIFIGAAFLLCSSSVAWTIVSATIYHELAQELADYFLLTTRGGMKPLAALSVNFLSGLSVILGVIVILALPVDDTVTGCILSISAGVYVYIAASECMPGVQLAIKNHCDRLSSMLFFTLGAVPIGLVLITHGHCDFH